MTAIATLPDLEPRQDRSRATREQILSTTGRLLRSRNFETLTIQEIVAAAGCSTGAFYGRFHSKEDLLPHLLEQHDAAVLRLLDRALASARVQRHSLAERLAWMARMNVAVLRNRRWLVRALAVHVRRNPAHVSAAVHARQVRFTERARTLLDGYRDQFVHADTRSAVDFALFLILTLCRERTLFGEMSQGIVATHAEMSAEIGRAAFAYLTGKPAPTTAPGV